MVCMKKNLETITQLAADAGNPEWHVSTGRGDVTPRGQEYFHLVEDALDEHYGRNALNFGTDARTVWFTAAAVNSAPVMAASLLSLAALAESIPEDAPEALREMAAAILDAAASVPGISTMPAEYDTNRQEIR